ncbi:MULTISPECIES: MFS transporter [Amycolatopsis]|uniref:MFS transporter n=1 Tax=Amycolatopsis tucumanensis TaxID=401106 RepID=A0ABP7HAK1_9PSEU|nr:MFS transporter [Amycolatopsis tucumanensis]MCF6421525.1 MFS transporter [Amycolatopsis tucumanensis]
MTQAPVPRGRIYFATVFGHLVEWYEFSVYGFVAVHIGATFFPGADPMARLLATFGVFGFTFGFRPLGALFFGPLADRIGRRPVLVTVLLLMCGSTFAIGLLPGYATLGIAAPVLLVVLRGLQNFSTGGEFGSVGAFMIEHAPPGRRGYATSWLMFSAVVGFVIGSLVVVSLAAALGDAAMAAWGWRIPFLVAGPLGIVGLYIRLRLEDTPEFRALADRHEVAQSPLREALRYRREILTVAGLAGLHTTAFYLVLTFMVSYLTQTVRFGTGLALTATLAGAVAALVPMPFVSAWSDRIGRRPVLITLSAAIAVLAVPVLAVIRSSPAGAIAGQVVLGSLMGALVSTTLVSMTEIFPPRVRSAGSSFAYTISAALIGGTAPFVSTWLIGATGSSLAPAGYLAATALLALVAAVCFRERVVPSVKGEVHVGQ